VPKLRPPQLGRRRGQRKSRLVDALGVLSLAFIFGGAETPLPTRGVSARAEDDRRFAPHARPSPVTKQINRLV